MPRTTARSLLFHREDRSRRVGIPRPATSILAALALFLPATVASHATPPDMTEIYDQPFAASDGDLFVLRTTTDNMGLHTVRASVTMLVKIDIDSGDEQYWPVANTLVDYQAVLEREDGALVPTVTRTEHAVDPFAIMADHGAAPFGVVNGWFEEERDIDWNDEKVVLDPNSDTPFAFSAVDLIDRMRVSSARFGEALGTQARQGVQDFESFYAERPIENSSCKFGEVGRDYGYQTRKVTVVRVTCFDEFESHATSMVFPIRSVAKQ